MEIIISSNLRVAGKQGRNPSLCSLRIPPAHAITVFGTLTGRFARVDRREKRAAGKQAFSIKIVKPYRRAISDTKPIESHLGERVQL